ncbi:hypothetical protein [Ketobacter sp.]|uniref:hypothetical protein n=1 Tax=Ketobacter sp. TaxID=2083498 RepID=UPI000F2769DB|nr:hypothetical protein [Ketobacter sp.]RLU00263.1 MAG: hypothetical protein D9N14_07170 [Ketobacter sp.]
MRPLALLMIACVLAACSTQPAPTPMKIGNKVEFALLQDQFANPFPHAEHMEMLVFTNDMTASRDVRDALQRIDPACYNDGKLVFIADVSGMPTLITRLIALPKMRGYGFPVWLDYEGEATEALPVREDHVSLIRLQDEAITDIAFVQGMESVMNTLVPLCGLKAEQVAQR